jgi:hypothetical protein
MNGSFQTSRELFQNPIWKNIVEFRLFFLIYGSAVFSEQGVRVSDDLVLHRGQWLRSTRKLQEDLQYIENRQVKKYSTATINRCIKSLVKMQRLCTKTHELGTVFTVVNYELYQGFGSTQKQNLEHNLEQSRNSDETVTKQSRNNNKNVNKDNKDKNDKNIPPQFEEFWDVFPRKIGKQVCLTTWKAVLKKGSDPESIILAAGHYKQECQMKNTEEQYILHPKTFLNKDRWKDFTEPPKQITNVVTHKQWTGGKSGWSGKPHIAPVQEETKQEPREHTPEELAEIAEITRQLRSG